MTPKDLIATCRNTAAQMPKGATIADTVERLLRERNDIAHALKLALEYVPEAEAVEVAFGATSQTLLDLGIIRAVAAKYGVDLGA